MRIIRLFSTLPMLSLLTFQLENAWGAEVGVDIAAERQDIVNSNPDLQALENSISELRRKANLLKKQAKARTGAAQELLSESQNIRTSAYGQSMHLAGVEAGENSEARETYRRADARGKALGYAGARAGNELGGEWGALAGWLITTTATSGQAEAQIHEDLAARKRVEARMVEKEAELRSQPLETRARNRETEADRLIQQAELYDSLAYAKELLFEARLSGIEVDRIINAISKSGTK